MVKETITYRDFNDVEVTEDFYFNLTKAEITEMQLSTVGGFDEMVKKIISANDTPSLIKIFKELVLKAYGEKSPDGKRFMKKNGELAAEFAETNAYSELFMKLATDSEAAVRFINGVVPSDLAQEAAKQGGIPALSPVE